MKIKASKADVIWSYIGTFFSLSSGFLLLPFVMLKLTGSELGLWYIFLAINGLVSLFDFGFDPTFARNIAYAWGGAQGITKTGALNSNAKDKSPNYHLLAVLLTTSKYLYSRLSLIAISFIGSFGTIYVVHVAKMHGYTYIVAWVIFCAGLFLNLYLGYYSALLRGIGAVQYINRSTMMAKLCQLVSSIGLLFFNLNLIAVSIGFVVNGLFFRIFCNYYFNIYQNTGQIIHKELHSVEKYEINIAYKAVSYNAYRDGVVSISNYLSTQVSSLIASSFLSLSATGEYSILLQFSNAVVSVASTIIYAYHPTLQSAFQRHDATTEKEYIGRGLLAYYLLFFIGTVGVIEIVFPLLHVIKPTMNLNIILFIGISLYIFLWQHQATAASYISNTNKVPYVIPFAVASILGIMLSFILVRCTSLGVWSLVLGPGIIQLCFNNWYWLYLVLRCLQTNWIKIIKIGFDSWAQSAQALNHKKHCE